MPPENVKVNWIGLEEVGEARILKALQLAMKGRPIPEIARETGIPKSSLYDDIRLHGAYSHRRRQRKASAL
jgi:DNA-binding phage protein